jgi:geranylgeranyl diphosphate synthase, type III
MESDASNHNHENDQSAINGQSLNRHQVDQSLLEPFYYINSVPGKDVRGTLIDCFQYWFRVQDEKVLSAIKDIIGDLHNASLLIDDIEDNSRLRRGIPVAHSIFGIPNTINCANYVYFLALEKCQALNQPKATQVFVKEILNLHRGQGYDILWRDMIRCPTEEEYLSMVRDKTGGLFRLAVGMLQTFATEHCNDDFTKLVNDMAMYFQIRDDFINLADEEYMKSKSFCEDITEGKFSFPIVHAITNEKHKRLISILKQRTSNDDVKRYAQSLLKDMGSLDYSREKCTTLKQEICCEVSNFGDNPQLLKLIDRLHLQLEQMVTTRSTIIESKSHTDEP